MEHDPDMTDYLEYTGNPYSLPFHGGTTWENQSLKALPEPLLAFVKNGTNATQYADSGIRQQVYMLTCKHDRT
ncbi:hypothetical protein [Komagataeibacter rhaeticus]|uniref:hypothetical protein n=1 Tax=Komagataeibacter rhaeticus TaxID=215221 RepID=UPI00168B0D18|nr:hypothetical protein [Komagataeibacter rhaeticus]QOC46929.1 hypothetical protein ICJ78_01895 [Komagataeibacter rhaeticus]